MTTHPAHQRIAKANAITLAQLTEFAANRPEPRTPQHPETGCWCTSCDCRDRALEARAEEMAAEARGDYMSARDRDWGGDMAADRMFGA